MLVGAYDEATGPHLFQTCPSGNVYEYYATSIGARSQSAKTYLEKFMAEFPDADAESMIKHSLKALSGCVQTDKQLEASNTCVVVIGPDQKLTMIEDAALQPYLDAIELEGDMPANDDGAGGDVDAMAT